MFANKFEMLVKKNTISPLGVLWSGQVMVSIMAICTFMCTSNDYKTALKTESKITVI